MNEQIAYDYQSFTQTHTHRYTAVIWTKTVGKAAASSELAETLVPGTLFSEP